MKIQIRKQTTLSGQVVRVGEVHEASLSDGNFLIGIGFAILAPEVAPEVPKAMPEESKPKPKRRRKSGNDNEESGDQNHGSQPAAK